MDLKKTLGYRSSSDISAEEDRRRILRHTALQLLATELPAPPNEYDDGALDVAGALLENYREKARILMDERTPADLRIENFLKEHFTDLDLAEPLRLPNRSLVLDRHGMARELSLPLGEDHYANSLVSSYRVKNGVLHNPRHDRRTTAGTFHVTQGGLPIPGDKKAVPKRVFAKLFQIATSPPDEYMTLPFTENQEEKALSFVSLYIRPLVCPEVSGVTPSKSMEVRFFAPGQLVSNLDFVESIFGNAGDPLIPANDAGLDVEHWTGHTGCIILAPQMADFTKKELGLPHYDDASERQRNDKMCWKDASELYNEGKPFKLTCRSEAGVIITLIADNYFGYCKKEVKTQISYAANLFGNVEEEHAGGCVAYARYNLGEQYEVNLQDTADRSFDLVAKTFGDFIDVKPEGYGIDKHFPDLIYIPENASATLRDQRIRWTRNGEEIEIPLLPSKVYMSPAGYKLRMEKHSAAPSWRLVGESAEGVFCHKPCTVSGGGKSEISKSLLDYMHYGPIFVADLNEDFDMVQKILDYDFSTRWHKDGPVKPVYGAQGSRPVLGQQRTLGSVIKLLTPSSDYNAEYNRFLESIPNHIYALLFIIKRFEKPSWEGNWREHFSVDMVNGWPGHELKYRERKLVGCYLRVGFYESQQWRTFKLRQDFLASCKIQREDDITASVVVPTDKVAHLGAEKLSHAAKFIGNCEYRFFQRPDEAIHRGFDKQAEADLAGPDNFVSNFEPLTKQDVERMAEYVADFDAFSDPMQNLLRSMLEGEDRYVACSANPRKVDGVPTKNPRYLQNRPDLVDPFTPYVAERGLRLLRKVPSTHMVPVPVHAVLMGRRNNPPEIEKGIRSLAVYNPVHYQELPEFFMDLICSLTGKSPSTTGFGSEGALTKGPFNALRTSPDLNTALTGYILTGCGVFSSAAGHIGPNVQVDHDISLLVPEIWCRLTAEERDPKYMISEGCLEPLKDKTIDGKLVSVSRLGYRITGRFLRRFCGRIFDNPFQIFDETILKPELQDEASFYDGVNYICEAHRTVALRYFEDRTVEDLCPPLQAILEIMAYGESKGRDIHHPEIREMFSLEHMLKSDWYLEQLQRKQKRDIEGWKKHLKYIDKFLTLKSHADEASRLNSREKREYVLAQLQRVESPDYLKELVGFIGASKL